MSLEGLELDAVLLQEPLDLGQRRDGAIDARVAALDVGAERDEIALLLVGREQRAQRARGRARARTARPTRITRESATPTSIAG